MMWCSTCQSHHDFDYEYCPEKWARDRAHERRVRARRDRAELDARISSRSSVSKADFPAWWAAYWRREAATSLFDLHEPAEKSDEQHIHDALIFGTSFRRVTYDARLDPGVNSQGRAAYADVKPRRVAHMSTSWVHAGGEVPAVRREPELIENHEVDWSGTCRACTMTREEQLDFEAIPCVSAALAYLPLQVPGRHDQVLAEQRGLILTGLWVAEMKRRRFVATGSTMGWARDL